MRTWNQFCEAKKKKKKGIKMALDIEGEPVIVGTQKKEVKTLGDLSRLIKEVNVGRHLI